MVDDAGHPVSNGNIGNCVVSTTREGMPLLRYYNNDLIELRDGHLCKCGNTQPIMIHHGRKDSMVTWGNEERSFYELQEVVYSLSTVPFMWKVKVGKDEIVFVFQYTQEEYPSISHIKNELISKLGIPVELECNEIIPLTTLTEIPAYSKYVHIEKL